MVRCRQLEWQLEGGEVVGRNIQEEEIHGGVGVRGEEHEEGRKVAEVHGRKKQDGVGRNRTRRYMEE